MADTHKPHQSRPVSIPHKTKRKNTKPPKQRKTSCPNNNKKEIRHNVTKRTQRNGFRAPRKLNKTGNKSAQTHNALMNVDKMQENDENMIRKECLFCDQMISKYKLFEHELRCKG